MSPVSLSGTHVAHVLSFIALLTSASAAYSKDEKCIGADTDDLEDTHEVSMLQTDLHVSKAVHEPTPLGANTVDGLTGGGYTWLQQMFRLIPAEFDDADVLDLDDSQETYSWKQCTLVSTISLAIWMVLSYLVWSCAYTSSWSIEKTADYEQPATVFTEGHFRCFQAPQICICATFCPALRWADTVDAAGFLEASVALAAFFGCTFLNGATFTFVYGVFTFGLMFTYRQKLRLKLGLKAWSLQSCIIDSLFVFFCPCCAIAQEARVVKYAYQDASIKDFV